MPSGEWDLYVSYVSMHVFCSCEILKRDINFNKVQFLKSETAQVTGA